MSISILPFPFSGASKNLQPLNEHLSAEFELDTRIPAKVPKTSVDRAIQSWPHLVGCSTMVHQFAGGGVRNKKLGQVIASNPQLLLRKPHEFLEVGKWIS